MSVRSLSVAEARAIDRDAVERLGMPSILLMENASRAVAEAARSLGDSWIILCGAGNNGGDGLAAARHLGRGARVHLLGRPDPERAPDAALQLEILERAGHPVVLGPEPAPTAPAGTVWIDALFGTGLARAPAGTAAAWIEAFNGATGPKLAADIPSGLNGDTGTVPGIACRADRTVTFVAPKHGMLAPGADAYVGTIEVAQLGLPQ